MAGLAGLFGVPLLGAAPDVPFLCHFRRAVEITDAHPYMEITEYLAGWRDHTETAYRTLSYFDTANLGRYAATPALFSVALMDEVCPPSTVFAAFNAYGLGDHDSSAEPGKQINVYPTTATRAAARTRSRRNSTGSPSCSPTSRSPVRPGRPPRRRSPAGRRRGRRRRPDHEPRSTRRPRCPAPTRPRLPAAPAANPAAGTVQGPSGCEPPESELRGRGQIPQ